MTASRIRAWMTTRLAPCAAISRRADFVHQQLLGLQHLRQAHPPAGFKAVCRPEPQRRSPGKTASSNRSTTSRWVKIVSQVSRGPSNSKASGSRNGLSWLYSKNDMVTHLKLVSDPFGNGYDADTCRKLAGNVVAYAMQN